MRMRSLLYGGAATSCLRTRNDQFSVCLSSAYLSIVYAMPLLPLRKAGSKY